MEPLDHQVDKSNRQPRIGGDKHFLVHTPPGWQTQHQACQTEKSHVHKGRQEPDHPANVRNQKGHDARRGPEKRGFKEPDQQTQKSATEQAAGDKGKRAGVILAGCDRMVFHVADVDTPAIIIESDTPRYFVPAGA